jgi:hypothetical protein
LPVLRSGSSERPDRERIQRIDRSAIRSDAANLEMSRFSGDPGRSTRRFSRGGSSIAPAADGCKRLFARVAIGMMIRHTHA